MLFFYLYYFEMLLIIYSFHFNLVIHVIGIKYIFILFCVILFTSFVFILFIYLMVIFLIILSIFQFIVIY